MKIKPLNSKQAYEAALFRVEELMDATKLTPNEGDELDILATLVEAYEEKHFPIDAPDPIALIEHYMDALGLSRKDLEASMGSKSKVSEVLNKKRKLSIEMVRKLNKKLGIPAEGLIKDYKLKPSSNRKHDAERMS